jgi:FkbM family methyltransferase
MKRLGTGYGGWMHPVKSTLGPQSIVYSAGVGEDISFDILLNDIYKSKIVLIDPTPRAIQHYKEVQEYFETRNPSKFTGSIQPEYLKTIHASKPDFSAFSYVEKGLWDRSETLKFFKQENPSYVSQSVIPGLYGEDCTEVPVISLKELMKERGDTQIDLLKLDIEGAEIRVLNDMLDSQIFPKYLCVEFDLKLKGGDKSQETEKILERLKGASYKVLSDHNWNMVFEKSGP